MPIALDPRCSSADADSDVCINSFMFVQDATKIFEAFIFPAPHIGLAVICVSLDALVIDIKLVHLFDDWAQYSHVFGNYVGLFLHLFLGVREISKIVGNVKCPLDSILIPGYGGLHDPVYG
ncbi:hypothetical protein DPMN_165890 [Dreissena polymorpha]|uniref:Uncharacterized protein n=1 Tax=Dreissena polymorpha TaxID=45954 RepID=A0A9D4ITP2_DREPO|nr:hypothetical protein DPMN_165890 [Dreissena polymorpha]